MIDEETYAAMADAALEARLEERLYAPTDAEFDAMLWVWEEDTASWCDRD